MEIIIKGEAKEIAALVVAIQERQNVPNYCGPILSKEKAPYGGTMGLGTESFCHSEDSSS